MNFKNLGFQQKYYSIDEGFKLFFDYQQSLSIKSINHLSGLFFPLVQNFNLQNANLLKNVFETTCSKIFYQYPDKSYLKKINLNFILSINNFLSNHGNEKILDFFVFYFLIFFILPLTKITDFNHFEKIITEWVLSPKKTGTLENAFLNGTSILKKLNLQINWNIGNKIALIIGLFQEIYYLGYQKSFFDNNSDQKLFALCCLINHPNILICENYPYVLYLIIYEKKYYFSNNLLEVLNKINLFNINVFNLNLIKQYLENQSLMHQLCNFYSKT